MKWNPAHDRGQQQVAAALTRDHRPYWWVRWSYPDRWWEAYFTGPATVAPLRSADPAELSQRMRSTLVELAKGRLR